MQQQEQQQQRRRGGRRRARVLAAFALGVLVLACEPGAALADNACSNNTADVSYWEREGFAVHEDDLDYCGKDSVGDRDLAEECVDKRMYEYTEPCQTCFVDIIVCAGIECGNDCIGSIFTGSESQECRVCVETTCNDPFAACAGFRIETCDTCVVPSESTFPTLIVVAGSVGGLVALVLAVLFVRWLCRSPLTPEQKAARLEKQGADLGIIVSDSRHSSIRTATTAATGFSAAAGTAAGSTSMSRTGRNSGTGSVYTARSGDTGASPSPLDTQIGMNRIFNGGQNRDMPDF
ncbi:Hypothetical Protein FCC1311_020922 [Hondaea fermentalgiana]|uniref:Uncharacterized protein n=1 Tax=Hondaea fermentalgiana TaxID=2315210 RepID=A0A2R5GBC8_9STRA|nr:Hypothetical Protein FCC1311_020922 [Hondaea fermentalgiana]|eukprot:GBG25873.1 Hypothetical Protein FCC1311_020922 [Hondaea fermentalgiana]